MVTYYSVLKFESERPFFLGKIPLVDTPDGVALDTYEGQEPLAKDGTVPQPWISEENSTVPLPTDVETTDPFQVAPMASFYQRPMDALENIVDGSPTSVHVFTTDTDDETTLSDVEAVEYYENVADELAGGDIKSLNRGYNWDDTAINMDAPDDRNHEFNAATYLIGSVDGQDMYDPYSHLGVSTADSIPQAFYNVLSELPGTPLWTPGAYPVDEHRSFEASTVLNL